MSFSDLIHIRAEMNNRGLPEARDYLREHFNEDGSPKYNSEIYRKEQWKNKLEAINTEIRNRVWDI